MSTIIDSDPTPAIARRLQQERQTRGLSLSDLARRTGVSKAMISKIERGEASPTAAVLGKLAAGFQLTVATLLARAEAAVGRLVRAQDQARWRDPETDYSRRQVFLREGSPLELVEVALPAGASVSYPAAAYTSVRHLVWVLSGRLAIHEGSAVSQLHKGDSLELGPPSDVTYRNPSARPCRYLVFVCRT